VGDAEQVAGGGTGCSKQRKGGADRRKGITLTSGPGRSVREEGGKRWSWAAQDRRAGSRSWAGGLRVRV
jgi:hypothetical protein